MSCTEGSGERRTFDARTAEDAGLQQDAWHGQDGAPLPDSDFKQRGAHQYTSEGSVVALWHQAIGTRITRCLFDAELQGPTGSENWGAIFIEGATQLEIADNVFRNFNSSSAGNASSPEWASY